MSRYFHSILFIFLFFIPAFSSAGTSCTNQKKFTKGQAFSSPFGKRKKIVLPDKTEITLNSNTTVWLDRDFGRTNRDVRISGDALFNISRAKTPFIIHTPHLVLTTQAALIRVNGYDTEAGEETLVARGKIRAEKSYYSELDHDPYFLKEGEMVMMNKSIDLIEKETFEKSELDTWIAGKIVFNNASLNDFITRLKTWFNIEMEAHGSIPPNLWYTGYFSGSDLQYILHTVGILWKFKYQAHGNVVTLKF